MTKSQVSGFRRMRTITALMFETVVQLMVQFSIFSYFYQDIEAAEEFGVSFSAIILSIIFATLHAVLETFLLYCES
jgi:heme/copper-type cytochrome/quinol oxidase subunit 4